ncbi:MAG: class I SAM-dependent methyltransferase [Candidatus Aminicenantaceae bacterium]
MNNKPWQLQLIKKSLKKKQKLKILNKYLKIDPSSTILDLGCAQGILSYFLQQKGGTWISTDLDLDNLNTSRNLLKKNLIQIGPGVLPFKDKSFDWVISLDYLEHLDDDQQCLEEIHRILKTGGQVLLATPRTGNIFILHKIRSFLGLKLEFYGHKREGYTLKDLKTKFEKANLIVFKNKRFSQFFSEFLELVLNFVYIKFLAPKRKKLLRDGHIRPSSEEEFHSKKKALKLYNYIYPVVRLLSLLDIFLFWQRGYGIMVWAEKEENNPQKKCR